MEKLKIYLGQNRDLKTEILDCLTTLGYMWKGEKDYLDTASPEAIYTSVYVDGDISLEHSIAYSMFYHLSPDHRVVTIDDLRTMTNPAQPSEPDPFLKEYLTPDYKLMLASDPQDGWIEVPEGAELYAYWPNDNSYNFHSGKSFFEDDGWNCCGWGVDKIKNGTAGAKALWQRDPQPVQTIKFSSELPSLKEYPPIETVYHYSASINTARGTVSYDGVVTFTGRITGIEDYRKVRAEIAKDGNVTPEQVNVHSLTIVG